MKKKLSVVIVLLVIALLVVIGYSIKTKKDVNGGFGSNPNLVNIEVSIFNGSEEKIYEKKIETSKTKLFDALKNVEDLTIESGNSQYGEFITSFNGVKQEENSFWNYYINDEYATVGVSEYNIKDNDKIKFILEKFE